MGTRIPLLLLGLVLIHHASEVMSTVKSCTAFCANGVDDTQRLLKVTGQGSENQFIYDAEVQGATFGTIGGVRSASLCFGHCIKNSKCKMWSYFPSDYGTTNQQRTCVLKSAVRNFSSGDKVISGYKNFRTSCSQPKVEYKADGTDVITVGNQLTNIKTEQEAQMNCAATAECKFYTWDPISRKSQNLRGATDTAANLAKVQALGSVTENHAMISGPRTCYNCYMENVDFTGQTTLLKRKVINAKACQDLCNDTTFDTCTFFVFHYKFPKNCWLYAKVGKYKRPGTYAVAGARCCCPAP